MSPPMTGGMPGNGSRNCHGVLTAGEVAGSVPVVEGGADPAEWPLVRAALLQPPSRTAAAVTTSTPCHLRGRLTV